MLHPYSKGVEFAEGKYNGGHMHGLAMEVALCQVSK